MELCPGFFVVGLDGGVVLGKGVADAEEGVHVRIGDVVDELPDCPAAFAVGGIELALAELGDGVAEVFRELGEDGDGGGAIFRGDGGGRAEVADGVAWIGRGLRLGVVRGETHGAKRSTMMR